ncbi:MAG: RMD1 family protein [Magnetococcales bacterium]|nr:RMD1 family protein [Magnetococcales bacterium]
MATDQGPCRQQFSFDATKTLSGVAIYLGERLMHRELEREPGELGPGCHALPVCRNGLAVLFRFGVVVLFGVDPEEERAFLERIEPLVLKRFAEARRELVQISIGNGNRFSSQGDVHLAQADVPSLAVVADVLAKSLVLEHHENEVALVFDQVEPLAEGLRQGWWRRARGRELLGQIGDTLLVEQRTVGRVEVTERPAFLWDFPQLERLHHELAEEYEIADRSRALERKLSVIARTTEMVLGLLHTHRSLRVEWYVVILILVEIGLTLYELFGRH